MVATNPARETGGATWLHSLGSLASVKDGALSVPNHWTALHCFGRSRALLVEGHHRAAHTRRMYTQMHTVHVPAQA